MELWEDTIYVTGLPKDITEQSASLSSMLWSNDYVKMLLRQDAMAVVMGLELEADFRASGSLISLGKSDKTTGEPKGDATVSYEDPNGAKGAVDWFNNKPFEGSNNTISVSIAQRKASNYAPRGNRRGGKRAVMWKWLTFAVKVADEVVTTVGTETGEVAIVMAMAMAMATAEGADDAFLTSQQNDWKHVT
eukprot:768746-Hanusia_phi.AAC.2